MATARRIKNPRPSADEAPEDEAKADLPPTIARVQIDLWGIKPLLMHNERLANPFDPITRDIAAITSKRTRQTEDDKRQVQRLEWEGGLYFDRGAPAHGELPARAGVGPYIPSANLKKCLVNAGAIYRAGTSLIRALFPEDTEITLLYDGPRDIDGLWEAGFLDARMVGVQRNKVLRTRPKFEQWALSTVFMVETTIVDIYSLTRYLETAGTTTGLGDYRPTFGRFRGKLTPLTPKE